MGTGQGARGSLLIISLWLVTILSVLAVAIGRYLSTEVRLARYQLVQARAAALARGGVYAAMSFLETEAGTEAYDWLGDEWARVSTATGDDNVWVIEQPLDAANPLRGTQRLEITITDEERKFNLQSVTDAGTEPFRALEALLDNNHAAAVALLDWMDTVPGVADNAFPGTESDEVTGWRAKNGPAARLEELFAIPGLHDVAPETMRANLSIYYGLNSKPNINTVSPAMLSALGLQPLANLITACRQGQQDTLVFDSSDPNEMISDANNCLGGALSASDEGLLANFSVESQTFAVVTRAIIAESDANGTVRPPVRACVEAVVRRKGCEFNADQPCIVAWGSCPELS